MISILSSPQALLPVYNPIYLKVSSNKTSEEAFAFVFDVYVNGNFVTRNNLLPLPATTVAVFSPARILESYLTYDLTHNLTGGTGTKNNILGYEVKIGEEYLDYWLFTDNYTVSGKLGFTGNTTHTFVTGDTIYIQQNSGYTYGAYNGVYKVTAVPNPYSIMVNGTFLGDTPAQGGKITYADKRKKVVISASITGNTFNGVLQYEEVPVWNPNKYKMLSAATGSFLTNQPSNSFNYKLSDRGSIGWMNIQPQVAGAKYWMVIQPNPTAALPILPTKIQIIQMMFTSTLNMINEVGIYPWNLNKASQALGGYDAITSSVNEYQIYLQQEVSGIFSTISEVITFKLNTKCSKYQNIRFMFLNALGQFDYFNADLVSKETINISRTLYQKTLDYNYKVGDRGKTVIGVEANQTYIANTDWISEEEAAWLVEMAITTECYILNNATGTITPVVLDFSSYEPKKRVNEKLINYTFSYSKAVGKNTARG